MLASPTGAAVIRWPLIDQRQDQLATRLLQQVHRNREVHAKVKAVGDLLGLGSSERRAFGLEATTIPGTGRDFGMTLNPSQEAFSGTIRQKLDHSAEVRLTKICSVASAFAPSPIVDFQVGYGENGVPRVSARRSTMATDSRASNR
jgi:hypothetical protein